MPTRRTLFLAAVPLAAAPRLLGAAEEPKEQAFAGQVVPLAELLKAEKIDLEEEAAAPALALKNEAGAGHFILKTGGSLPLFRDAGLRRRPVRLAGRFVLGGLLLVRQFFLLKDGKPFAVHYWCEVCAIKRFARDPGGVCECCGGPMERKETPAE